MTFKVSNDSNGQSMDLKDRVVGSWDVWLTKLTTEKEGSNGYYEEVDHTCIVATAAFLRVRIDIINGTNTSEIRAWHESVNPHDVKNWPLLKIGYFQTSEDSGHYVSTTRIGI